MLLSAVVALAAVVVGVTGWDTRKESLAVQDKLAKLKERHAAEVRKPQPVEPLAALAPFGSHLDDLDSLFQLVARHHLTGATATYSKEQLREARIVLRRVELPLDGSYADVKAFAADVLRKSRNAYISAFRVDPPAAQSASPRFVLQLTYVYRDMEAGDPVR
ncbi:hypothetical protein [Ramlibacter humi]|uniref:Uncharacterized protein n=1 Tax=Ramlibacter humi TaxID=2530451 RepID=A0A4Z0BE17_9BURK|nr:hypothetical protein [Ramlibacter humi]TFY96364.1 hypothetical protein EZ216_20735 [Ramlibacter humi]